MKLFVDDIRPCPEGWTVARTFDDALTILRTQGDNIAVLSLDHDLGCFSEADGRELTGYTLVQNLLGYNISPRLIFLHTDNAVGRDNMYQSLQRGIELGLITTEKVYRYRGNY